MNWIDKSKAFLGNKLNLPKQVSFKTCALIFVLLVVYIVNRLGIEDQLRTISALSDSVKELRYEQITTSSKLMDMSKQSEVIRRVEADRKSVV